MRLRRALALALALALLLGATAAAAFESLLHAHGELNKDRPVRPRSFASPDWTLYQRSSHLLRSVLSVARDCPLLHVSVNVATAHASPSAAPLRPRDALPDSAADGLLYLTLQARSPKSNRFSLRAARPGASESSLVTRSLFVFGEEGRDLLTAQIALRVLNTLCSNRSAHSAHMALPPNAHLILVPLANPDGRRIAEMGRRCDRTNGNDVHIDRNWPAFWRYDQPYPHHPNHTFGDNATASVRGKRVSAALRDAISRTFKHSNGAYSSEEHTVPISATGTNPFSEPETRALNAIVSLTKPTSHVSLRTGSPAILFPWDCRPQLLSDEQFTRLWHVVQPVKAAHCTRCKHGSLQNLTGVVKCGTSTDYMFGNMRVPFVYGWHVYEARAMQGDCFRRHNPLNKDVFERVVHNWAAAVLNFTVAVHHWMCLEAEQGLDVAEQNASLSAAEATIWRAKAIANGMPDPENVDWQEERGSTVKVSSQKDVLANGAHHDGPSGSNNSRGGGDGMDVYWQRSS